MACPTGARHFGDLGDKESAVSKLVAARGGYDLLPEMGYKPTNKYLPPRPRKVETPTARMTPSEPIAAPDGSPAERLFAWVDKVLSA